MAAELYRCASQKSLPFTLASGQRSVSRSRSASRLNRSDCSISLSMSSSLVANILSRSAVFIFISLATPPSLP